MTDEWTPAERVLLDLLRQEGPLVTAGRAYEVIEEAGYSRPTASNLLKGSLFIERVARATYALVGTQTRTSPEDFSTEAVGRPKSPVANGSDANWSERWQAN